MALQACTADGTVYDITNIVPYVQKFKRHPASGEPLQLKDVIKLNFYKNSDGEYHCPMLHKVGTAPCCSCCWKWVWLRGACTLVAAASVHVAYMCTHHLHWLSVLHKCLVTHDTCPTLSMHSAAIMPAEPQRSCPQ